MLDLEMLSQNTKQDSYEKCDKRLTNFIDALTSKAKGETIDCTNFKYNAYDNLLKARNS